MIWKLMISSAIFAAFLNIQPSESLNILGVFPYQGKSHFFVFKPYLEELANRGHNVTVISHFPQRKAVKKYHDISLAGTTKILEDEIPVNRNYMTIMSITILVASTGVESCRVMLENENVQRLWKANTTFDLVVTEQFNSDCSLGLAYKLKAPVVGVNSHLLLPWFYNRFGIPHNPSYVSFEFLDGGTKPTLYQRVERTIFDIYIKALYKYYVQRSDEKILAKYFGDDIPPLEDLGREIKILLHYNYFVLSGSTLLPPNIIEVAGYHVAKPNILPADIRKFIEDSEHGIIYISFGFLVKASTLSNKKRDVIINAISKLPQKAIWKWEEDSLPGNPKDIYISKWLPQNDILAHPKIMAFFSHGGQLGTVEAVTYGVPMVTMPIHGDQGANAAAIEECGFGIKIDFKDLTEENLLQKFKIILDPKFKEKAKMISKAFLDRPMSAMDSAIYWTEFAARYPKFTFRSRSADVPLYQYLCLDVIAVITTIILALFYCIKLLIFLCYSKKSQEKSKNKKN